MKYLIIMVALFLTSCDGANSKREMEGIYVGHLENEYGTRDDTLIIKRANEKNMFELTWQKGIVRKLDGKIFPKEWKTEHLVLDYNPDKQTFFDLRHGRTLVWVKANSTIQLGGSTYRKIK